MNCKTVHPSLTIELQVVRRQPDTGKRKKLHTCSGNCRNCPNNRRKAPPA